MKSQGVLLSSEVVKRKQDILCHCYFQVGETPAVCTSADRNVPEKSRLGESLEINAEDFILTCGKWLKSNLQGEGSALAKNMDSSYCYGRDKNSRDVYRRVLDR